jgi:hypothetical protein
VLRLSTAPLLDTVLLRVSLSVASVVIFTGLLGTDGTPSAWIVATLLTVRLSGVLPWGNRTLRVNDPIDPAVTTGAKFTVRFCQDAVTLDTGYEKAALIYWSSTGSISVILIFIQSSAGDTDHPHDQSIW